MHSRIDRWRLVSWTSGMPAAYRRSAAQIKHPFVISSIERKVDIERMFRHAGNKRSATNMSLREFPWP